MEKTVLYDLAIVGAGAAGLQFLYEFIQKPENAEAKILLIDSGDRTKKSWCFWAENDSASFSFLIEKSWSKITYRSSGSISQTQEIGNLNYHYISSDRFFNFFFDQFIPANPQVLHETAWVEELRETDEFVDLVLTNGTSYSALQVADARFEKSHSLKQPELSQHFWGKFVEFKEDILDSTAMTLMDFSQEQINKDYALFHYILPFSSRRALIETTVFSTESYDELAYEAHWNQYMLANFSDKDYKVIDIERGTIPMTVTTSRHKTAKIFPIGTAAGQVKGSTGYAFTRMHRDAKQKVNQLPSLLKARHIFYDSILLHMIATENKAIPLVMNRLFARINFNTILQFLDEKTTIWDEVKIFSQLQIPLFVKHLLTKNR